MNHYREVKSTSLVPGELAAAHAAGSAEGVEEIARWSVGRRTFVAERVVSNGSSRSRIRIDGTDEMMEYLDRADVRDAAGLSEINSALADWLPGRTPVRKA
jgi:hypothetical protein